MGMADPEVESAREPYSCHFQFPDPISKVAGSRTTRYRLCKKRKLGSHTDSLANCDDIEDNSQAVPFDANDVEDKYGKIIQIRVIQAGAISINPHPQT